MLSTGLALSFVLAACDGALLTPAGAHSQPGLHRNEIRGTALVPLYVPASLAGVMAAVLPDVPRVVASTASLARQLERGARPGVFLSASPQWLDAVAAQDRLEPGTRRDFARNRLVLVESQAGLRAPPRFCTGDPAYVPLGQYTQAVFENLGRWQSLRAHILPASDARRARYYLQRGACRFGILYASDARPRDDDGSAELASELRVIARVPARLHPPVRYEIAVLRAVADPDAARELHRFLLEDPGVTAVLRARGFAVDARPR